MRDEPGRWTHRRAAILATGVCALGLSVVSVGAPAPACAAPTDSTSSDHTRADAPARAGASTPSARSAASAPPSRANVNSRLPTVIEGRAGLPPATAGSAAQRRSAMPSTEAAPAEVVPTTAESVPPTSAVSSPVADRANTTQRTPTPEPPAAAVDRAPTVPVVDPAPAASSPSPAQPAPTPAPAAAVGAAATGSATPAGNAVGGGPAGQPIGDVISGALQLMRRALFNQVPTAAPVQAMVRPSGQIWGFVAGSDPEGDPITYTLNQSPKFGTVSITPSGVYKYTPGTGFSGTDSFTVTIENPGFHVNLLRPFASRSRDIKVNVTASGNPTASVVDNFNGSAGSPPDPGLWGYHLGPYRDDGLQTYTNSTDNARVDGQGHLVIQANQTANGYTSARLVTQDKLAMKYGVVQASIKMPAGQGIWPSFWMLGTSYNPDQPSGWPACGEIDIMELVNNGKTYNVALHGPQGNTDYYGGSAASGQFVGTRGQISSVAPIIDLTNDYHDYWLMWRENQIVVGVDNTMLADLTPASLPSGAQWVFNEPMYAVLQVAVGGPWPGPPDATTPWPATMLVDSFSYTPLP